MTREQIQKELDNSLSLSERALEFSCMLEFDDLGWECVNAEHEQDDNKLLNRISLEEVVIVKYLNREHKELYVNYLIQLIKKCI